MKLLSSKHIEKIGITDKFLEENLNINIEDFINKYYQKNELKDIFIKIIRNNFDQKTVDFLRDKLGDMNRFRDKRSAEEYACDLLLGWIVEDAIIFMFEKLGYKSEIVSLDKNREFLKRPGSKIDLKIHINNDKTAVIELVADNTGFWKRTKKIHLREQKYDSLKKQNAILLGLDFLNSTFFIKEIKNMQITNRIPSHFLYGGKPATECSLENIKFHLFNNMKKILEHFFKDK